MTLLPQVLRRSKTVHIRRPDYVETRNGCSLQIWGPEDYWQVVDQEFREFLQSVEKPKLLNDVFGERPDWKPNQRMISAQLKVMEKAGLGGPNRPAISPPAIENLTLNLVTACNLHCHTCYVPDSVRTATKLDPDQAIQFLEALRPCLSPQATLSLLGGEPFLHPEGLAAIGRWAKQHGIPCNVSTNGTMLSARLLRILQDTGLKVQVSLDGATPETNDAIRGAGTFEKAITCIQRLVAAEIPVTMCMVCCQQNVSEIHRYFLLARKLNVPEVRFIPLKKLGNSSHGAVTPASQLAIVSAICQELDADPSLIAMCRTDIYSIVKAMLRETSRRRTCGTGTQTLLVQADGTVYPCINTTMPELALGHVNDGTGPVLKKGTAFGERLSLDSPAHPCHGCVVKRWCLAVCPGETLQRTAQLASPHWNCEDVKQTIIFVMWRLAQENKTPNENVARSLI